MSLGKTLNAASHLEAKQSTRCGGPAWRKTCKQNSFYVGVGRQYNILFKGRSNISFQPSKLIFLFGHRDQIWCFWVAPNDRWQLWSNYVVVSFQEVLVQYRQDSFPREMTKYASMNSRIEDNIQRYKPVRVSLKKTKCDYNL